MFAVLLILVTSILDSAAVSRVLGVLEGVQEKHGYWIARCPAHEDTKPSLSVKEGRDSRCVVRCHAGCSYEAIRDALHLDDADFFAPKDPAVNGRPSSPDPDPKQRAYLEKSYDYTDEHSALLYQACRYVPKDFRQRRPDGNGGWTWQLADVRRVLYRLPDVLEAIAQERDIFVVEGEKDADNLAAFGYCATTWAGGAKGWREEYARALAGASVICLPDNDEPGRACMQQVAASLTAIGARVRVVELPGVPEKGDISDWLDAGHDLDALDALVQAAPTWEPAGTRRVSWRLDELLDNPTIMRPPPIVVPRLAWSGRSTLLAAREKTGKSTLLGFIAAQVTRGGCFLDDPCARGTVLLVGLEEFVGDTARRLRDFQADATRVFLRIGFLGDPRERPRELAEQMTAIRASLIIVDSLAAYSHGQIQDDNNATQMTAVLQPLTDLAHDTGAAVVIVHHARKQDGRSRGSTAITAGTDVVCELFAPDEDADPTLRRMRSAGRVPLVRSYDFRFDGDTYTLSGGVQAPLEQRIVAYIQGHPTTSANAVVEALGARKSDVLRHITELSSRGVLREIGRGRGRQLAASASVAPSLLGDEYR